MDALAQERGLVALTGASTTPALSAAVVAELTDGWKRVDAIEAAITPGGASEVGQSVIEAILSYAGRPIAVWRGGRLDTIVGWGSAERWDVPGLGPRWVSPVETPDAELLSRRFDVRDRVRFLAGLESNAEHFGMLGLALVLRGIPQPRTVAKLLHGARRFTRPFCGDKGGMVVRVAGLGQDGAPTRMQWSLLAERDDGPYTPTLAAVAAVRALLECGVKTGARPCIDVLKLADIEKEMSNFAITTRREALPVAEQPLFQQAIGDAAYAALPLSLRAFHERDAATVWSGVADVDGGISLIARLARTVFGLPKAGRDVPISVTVERAGNGEKWTRSFGGGRFVSRMKLSAPSHVTEAIGPFAFDLALGCDGVSVAMPVVGWRLFGIPLPLALAPGSDSREFEDADGRYRFDVRLSMPLVGLLAHCRGWLRPGAVDDLPDGKTPSSPSVMARASALSQ